MIPLPSKAIDEESNREGAEDASDREDGHSDGPDGGEGAPGDLLLVAFIPRLIDEILNNLENNNDTKLNVKLHQLFLCFSLEN